MSVRVADQIGTEIRRTTWRELFAASPPRDDGILSARFVVGDPDDADAPLVFKTRFPPGCEIGAHTHACDYSEFLLEGRRMITRKWYEAGGIQAATAGTFYGPLISGPTGTLVIAVFATGHFDPVKSPASVVSSGPKDGDFASDRRHFFWKTSWEDLAEQEPIASDGTVSLSYVVGEQENPLRPTISKTHLAPGRGNHAHTHGCAFAQFLLDGELEGDDCPIAPGDIVIGKAGSNHGPYVAGPSGADVVTILAQGTESCGQV